MTAGMWRRMMEGAMYLASDPELVAAQKRCKRLLLTYNTSDPDDRVARSRLLAAILGRCDETVTIEPPFYVDYGINTTVGRDVYMNTGCVLLDSAAITIGCDVLLGPGVHLYTASHPLDPAVRSDGLECARPITLEDGVWLGGRVVVVPGVTIGHGAVIGAGSVVTHDVPPCVVAAGVPCRTIRALTEADRERAEAEKAAYVAAMGPLLDTHECSGRVIEVSGSGYEKPVG